MKADPFVQLRLLDLQALDSTLAQLEHRRRTLPEIAEMQRLDALVDALHDGIVRAETEVSDLAREQARFEREIDQVRTRRERDEGRLSSGAITVAKQLQDLEHEVATLKRRQSDLEDAELEVMEKAETAQAELDELTGQRAGHLAAREEAEKRRDAALVEIEAELARTAAERAEVAASLPPGADEQREGRDPGGRAGRGAAARGVRPDHGAYGGVRPLMPRRLVVEADGGSRGNPGPAGYGAVVRDAVTGEVLAERAAGIGTATNNVAEYGGLIAGLKAALELDPGEVEVRMDSKLVVEQMSGRWQVKHPAMKPLAREAAALVQQLPRVRFSWIPRAQNSHADRLANEAMDASARGEVWRPGGDTGPADAADAWLAEHEPVAAPETKPHLSGWNDPAAPPTTTILLRHGQTALSIEKRFSGSSDPELTAVGRGQAAAAAAHLAGSGAVAVVASPLLRTRQTAALVADALGVEVVLEPELRETDFGDWEGYTFAEVRQKWPRELDAWLADPAVAPPFGESFAATAVRVRQARDRVIASYGGQTVVLVSHVSPIKTLLRMALDAPPSALHRMHLDLASISRVQWFADGPAVVRSLNETAHLPEA